MKITLSISLLCIAATLSAQDMVLHNGIKISKNGPPEYQAPKQPEQMPVPYLSQKPDVIPVNVGRQFFVDDFLISSTNLTPTYHKAKYHPMNPVLEPDKEWEKTGTGAPYAAPFSDGVWFDEMTGKYRMWYLAGAGLLYKDDPQCFYTAYAESSNGIDWIKPSLNILEGTSVVDTCKRDAATVWIDREERDYAKRYKFFNVQRRASDKRWQAVLKYSADGIHWSDGMAQSGDMGDRTTAFYNPFTKKWVLSMRYSTPVSSRSRSYAEHSDPEMLLSLSHRIRSDVKDKTVKFWFTPDDKELQHPKFPDVKPGIYNFDAIAYESIILGQYSAWCGPENRDCNRLGIQKRNEISLGYSRDGFHFSRPTHQAFMGVNESDGAWNWGNVQSANGTPLIVGDSLYFYVSGRRLNDIMWDSYTSTGLATLRRDGFVSMGAGKQEGYLTTEKISFDGDYLFINAEIKGQLRVEVLDANETPIKGYTKDDAITIKKANATKIPLAWKNNATLSQLKDEPIRLKFYLTDANIYSFWISPWQSGESRGYTAGGGPGLSGTGQDIKQ